MIARVYQGLHQLVQSYSLSILVLMHVVGIVGLLSPYQEIFRLLTPVNLMVSAILLGLNHADRSIRFVWASALIFFFGFFVELIGVHTGFIFGEYRYGATLGPKLMGVPAIIGLNWLLIIYCIASLIEALKIPTWFKITLGSVLAVLIDMLIEPVAMKYDFWTWSDYIVPIQNYIGWFITSMIMFSILYVFKVKTENRIALGYYFIQLFFFLILFLLI